MRRRQRRVHRRQQARKGGAHRLSADEYTEHERCSQLGSAESFIHWCENYVSIIGERGECLFRLWPGQRRMVEPLVSGEFLVILKGRQLGFTWLLAAYCLWLLVFRSNTTIFVVNQETMYAEEFIRRVDFMHERLPAWCQRRVSKRTEKRLRFGTGGMGSEIIAVAGGSKAARSFTADLAIFDEASRIPEFAATLGAVQPAIEKRQGQIVNLTTSAGPVAGFYDLWMATYGDHGELLDDKGRGPTGFMPFFVHWSEAPGRGGDWYDRQKALLDALSPVLIKQEYPNSIQEAWEQAAGRCFPGFGPTNIGKVSITADYLRYRSIDWGETKSAYVVLWVATLPFAPPGLVVHPDCVNTIREMTHYRFDEDTGRPLKGDDHTCDALRYLVTTANLRGFVYIYREVYRVESLALGWTPMKEIREIHEMSGWVRGGVRDREAWRAGRDGERFETTVFDRSLGKMGALFAEHGIPATPCKRLGGRAAGKQYKDPAYAELLEGIRFVNNLIDGTEVIEHRIEITRQPGLRRVAGRPVTTSLIERRRRRLAEEYLRKRRS
jgi:Terminase large subunit, T4likevirus-type, N-terminal